MALVGVGICACGRVLFPVALQSMVDSLKQAIQTLRPT